MKTECKNCGKIFDSISRSSFCSFQCRDFYRGVYMKKLMQTKRKTVYKLSTSDLKNVSKQKQVSKPSPDEFEFKGSKKGLFLEGGYYTLNQGVVSKQNHLQKPVPEAVILSLQTSYKLVIPNSKGLISLSFLNAINRIKKSGRKIEFEG